MAMAPHLIGKVQSDLSPSLLAALLPVQLTLLHIGKVPYMNFTPLGAAVLDHHGILEKTMSSDVPLATCWSLR